MLFLIPFLPLAMAAAIEKREVNCAKVHIILARGNDEPYPGRQGALVTAICDRFDSCDYEDINYDIAGDPYCTTVNNGASGGLAQLTTYHQQCPDSAIVLSGYSQGGQVIGDILGGGGGTFYDGCKQNTNAALDRSSDAGSMIAAALLWGDIRHTASQSYNIQNGADKGGAFPRPSSQVAGMAEYADVLRSYCVDTDPICARGADGITHTTYFDYFSSDAADWVEKKIAAFTPPARNSTSSASSSGSATGSVSSSATGKQTGSTSVSATGSSSSTATGSVSGSISGSVSSTATGSLSGSATASGDIEAQNATSTASITGSVSASTTISSATSTITDAPEEIPTDIPEETNLFYTPSSTIAATLLYSSPVTIETPGITSTPVTTTRASSSIRTASTTSATASSTFTGAAVAAATAGMKLIGMAILGGAMVL